MVVVVLLYTKFLFILYDTDIDELCPVAIGIDEFYLKISMSFQ